MIAKMAMMCYNTPCVRTGRRSKIGMSPSGKASDFDSDIRRFESGHPSHLFDPLAQLAEQLPFKQWVRGSNPRRVTKKCRYPLGYLHFLFERKGIQTITSDNPVEKYSKFSIFTASLPGFI